MRCDEAMEILEETRTEELAPPLKQHLAECAACKSARADLRMLRAGFRALSEDAVPEASLGFSTRVIRRLSEAAVSGGIASDFVERIGRRFVWAGLLAAVLMLMALVLPSSGPLRGPTTAEIYLAQPEPNPQSDVPLLAYDSADAREAASTNSIQGGDQK